MGHSLLIFEAMKVTLVLVASFALVFGQECPEPVPCKDDEMSCGSTWDEATGCMNPEICVPMKGGPVGKDGIECPVTCPCKDDEMTCDMGFDEAMGCQNPPQCTPMTSGGDINGNDCPGFCRCHYDQMECAQGYNDMGCENTPVTWDLMNTQVARMHLNACHGKKETALLSVHASLMKCIVIWVMMIWDA